MVASVYYQDKNLERIVKYCQKDTLTVAHGFNQEIIVPGFQNRIWIKREIIYFL